jgi:hypothetical protein
MAATLVFEEVHVTASVITTVLPSSNVPVAINCWVSPEVIDAVVGVTSIDFRLAYVTETVVAPLMDPDAAVMLAVPAATPVASPVLLTVAISTSDDVQVAEFEMFLVLPSL